MIVRACAASFSSNAVASSVLVAVSPSPSNSRACSSVISVGSPSSPACPYEIESCSSRFSASRRLPHAIRAIISRTPGSASISSASQTSISRSITSSLESRLKSNRWQRLMTVAGSFWASVVARIITMRGGGSSSVFSSALNASRVSMCTSSMMYTLYLPETGWNRTFSRSSRIASIPRFEAASISIRSRYRPSSIAIETSESAIGSPSSVTSEFSALARILAVDVLPTPRGPVKRYACETRSEVMARFRVWVTCC